MSNLIKTPSRADLHVHSKYSNRPSMWALRRFDCPESFSEPVALYEAARRRGMDFVTITDHNSIDGAREIAHLPNTFMSTELTAHFPENDCQVHVVVLGLTESQFSELVVLRKNIYELVHHLRAADLTHFLAHPLYDVNGRLDVEMVEKFLLLFNVFEGRNGGRGELFNELFVKIASSLTPETIEVLANKYAIEPYGPQPWIKGLVGGSDDHGGLYVGQTFTEVAEASSVGSFIQALREGKGQPRGEHGGALTLAHSVYAVAYQFFRQKAGNRSLKSYPFLGALLDNMFGNGKGLSRSARLKLVLSRTLPEIYPAGNRSRRLEEVLDREIRRLLNDRVFRDQLAAADFNRRVFAAGSYLANRLLYHYTAKLLAKKIEGGIMDLVNSVSTVGFVHLVTAPYYIAQRSQSKSKPFLRELSRAFLGEPGPAVQKIALFSDTLQDVNGVALTVARAARAATAHQTELVVIGCSNRHTGRTEHGMNFQALGDFGVPEYPHMRLHFPPILDVLDFVERERFDRIHVSTPGPQGLLGLLLGRLMGLPVTGTYHTDIPQYVGRLTADQSLEETAWNYVIWFYNQLDEVLVPSCWTRDQLLARGLLAEKARPLPRWVDTEFFTPEHRDCSLWASYGADQGVKLLYAGRVSREKNLELLAEAFMELQASGSSAWLVVVGDGPYREEMEARLRGQRAIFTGFVPQQALARLYASADVLVFPSTTDTFGNVVLEAQACGLPVVVTDAGGPQELMLPGETGLVVAANDKLELTRAMSVLSEDHELRARLGAAARRFAEQGALSPSLQFATLFGCQVDWSWVRKPAGHLVRETRDHVSCEHSLISAGASERRET